MFSRNISWGIPHSFIHFSNCGVLSLCRRPGPPFPPLPLPQLSSETKVLSSLLLVLPPWPLPVPCFPHWHRVPIARSPPPAAWRKGSISLLSCGIGEHKIVSYLPLPHTHFLGPARQSTFLIPEPIRIGAQWQNTCLAHMSLVLHLCHSRKKRGRGGEMRGEAEEGNKY